MQAVETPAFILKRKGSAELRLPAGALEEDDELACDGERNIASEIVFHQRQCQIDSGRHAGGGPDAAVLNEDRVGIEPDLGEAFPELAAALPVRDRTSAVQQPGAGQQKGTAADRSRSSRQLGALRDPADQSLILAGTVNAPATGNDQRVYRLVA